MMEICGDNRFEIIAKAKADLLESTNIETDEAEMAVIDNILFRCWQMGWLDRYDRKTENCSEKPNNCEDLQDWKDRMWAGAVIEPQYDFGEYADRLWKIAYERGKREALEQTEPKTCENRECKNYDTINNHCMFIEQCHYEPKDEPQTERSE